MLEIKPVQSKADQEKYCAMCGIVYDPEAFAYAALDERVFVCVSQFRIMEQAGYIYDIAEPPGADDLEAVILTARATLNFIDLCGTPRACIRTEYRDLPRLLGFTQADGEWTLELRGYFDGPCEGEKQKK